MKIYGSTILKKFFVAGTFLLATISFFSCEKIDQNPEYDFTIVVKTLADSSRIQNALVEVYVPSTVSDLEFTGSTNDRGEITFEYDRDAVFQVRASRGRNISNNGVVTYSYIGCTFVRLEPNDEVFQTVYIEPYDPEAPGCTL